MSSILQDALHKSRPLPSMPEGWRPASGQQDAEFACLLVERTMSPYWARRQMRFSREMFLQQWFDFDAYILAPDGIPAGVIAWSLQGIHGHLRELHLDESMRDQGRGRKVLEAWIAYCRGCGARHASLKVFAENPARNLYERVGFDVADEDSNVQGLLNLRRRI